MPWHTHRGRPLPPGWPTTRRRILARDPVCRACRRARAVEVDHVIPRSQGGADHDHNLAGVCHSCHQQKTQTEAAAARQANRTARNPKTPGIP